jgi:hypothetical protein
MKTHATLIAASIWLCGLIFANPALAAGFTTVNADSWNESAVRRVLHTFAYGGFATDQQIESWSNMAPGDAIQQMLTFDAVNPELSPGGDTIANYAGSLDALQALWSSGDPDNLACPGNRSSFNETRVRADGNVLLRNQGLQNTWIQAVRKRGLNPFRHKIGFWLVNYQMAVNLHDTEPPLIQELYDSALDALAQGAPFHEVLATGATSAAVAREYGHRTNTYNNNTGRFRGNDDFAREFHQLFFRINGDIEDPDYHENTTIEHTAWALTGMRIDKDTNAYGTTLASEWWVAPIDFTNHRDATNRNLRNTALHYRGNLEILHEQIVGSTAEDKLFDLAAVAINHPESLDNLPVAIVNFFADDNLTASKVATIRDAWRDRVGQADDFLHFLQSYAISTTFHRNDTFKYRTAFHRNMNLYNLNTVDDVEAYDNSFSPRAVMATQGAEVFIPVHDVFGGQTSLNAANNPNLFKEAYNSSVDFPNRVAKTFERCRNDAGASLRVWRKDWARVIPSTNGVYRVKEVGQWLWDRFISDNRVNYGTLERAQITALLATGMDFGYQANPNNPDTAYSADALNQEPLVSIVAANEAAPMDLDSAVVGIRREANRRVGLAINFISMTPFMFASQGMLAATSTTVPVPDVVSLAQADAEAAIAAAGLAVGTVTTQNSNTVPTADVISQSPAAPAQVAPGSAVNLVVSSGPAQTSVTVTDVAGLTQADAEAAITAANLTIGTVATQSSDTVLAGDVISQSPAAGASVASGSAVDLVVSSGPALDQRPLVTIDTPSDGSAFNEGDSISFGGSASDPEDGDLTANLSWSSSLDGSIGSGGSFSTTLSAGTHTITASVSDSSAQVDSDAIVVTVLTEADGLECKKAEYKDSKDWLLIEVKSTDKTGRRTMTAIVDLDGDGVFESGVGEIPLRRGSDTTYRLVIWPFVDPNPTAVSVIKVTSDLGGVCTRAVTIF